LILVHDFQNHHKDWFTAEAYALGVLPRELVFLFSDIFRFPREEVLAWLINVGHRIVRDLLADLHGHKVNGHALNSRDNPGGGTGIQRRTRESGKSADPLRTHPPGVRALNGGSSARRPPNAEEGRNASIPPRHRPHAAWVPQRTLADGFRRRVQPHVTIVEKVVEPFGVKSVGD
jgi:hypothetical protein